MPRKKTIDNSRTNVLNSVSNPATKFFNQYFSNLKPMEIADSPFDGFVGFRFQGGDVFFREIPLISYQVSSVEADASFSTVKSDVFEAKMEDGSPMLLFKLDWLKSIFFIWMPFTESDKARLCKAAKKANSMVTYTATQFGTLYDVPVQPVLQMIKNEVPHAEIKTAGIVPEEWNAFVGELSDAIKEIDKCLRPALSQLGTVPPLKSKERLAQDQREWEEFQATHTLEEQRAILKQRAEEQSRRGGDLVYRHLLGKTQAELLAMPKLEREAFMDQYIRDREEREARAKAEAQRNYQEMLEQQSNVPVEPVKVVKTRKTKSRAKSQRSQHQTGG